VLNGSPRHLQPRGRYPGSLSRRDGDGDVQRTPPEMHSRPNQPIPAQVLLGGVIRMGAPHNVSGVGGTPDSLGRIIRRPSLTPQETLAEPKSRNAAVCRDVEVC
jgi:hypothetical protein